MKLLIQPKNAAFRLAALSIFCLFIFQFLCSSVSLPPKGDAFPKPITPKPILIHVNGIMVPLLSQIYNHPWHLLIRTRRCSIPCAYVSTDKLYGRRFTQSGIQHQWVNDSVASILLKKADVVLSSNDASELDGAGNHGALKAWITSKPEPRQYTHNASHFSIDNRIHIEQGSLLDESKESNPPVDFTIGIGHGEIPYNLASRVFRDYFEFGETARSAALSPDRIIITKRKFMVAFLPDCSTLAPSHINYIVKLASLVQLDIYGGCQQLSKVLNQPSLKEKIKVSHEYRYVLVWEPRLDVSDFVPESFYESLVLDALPVIMGPSSLEHYLPASDAAFNARTFLSSPESLALELKDITDEMWDNRLKWKLMVNERLEEFTQLWDWSIESTVCRICHYVSTHGAPSPPSDAFINQESVDSPKLLMYLDQRRWYKIKKSQRKERHERVNGHKTGP